MISNIKRDLKCFNYKYSKTLMLWDLLFQKKSYSHEKIRWYGVLPYIFLKNTSIEIAKTQHLGFVDVLIT